MGGRNSKGETTCCGGGGAPATKVALEPAVKVVVTAAGSDVAYSLFPMIARGDMFGPDTPVIIHGLDLDLSAVREKMKAVKMELEDSNFALLQDFQVFTDEQKAFADTDYCVLLTAFPRKEGMQLQDLLEKNKTIFKSMGNVIDAYAKKTVKVLIAGQPSYTNCLLCSGYVANVPKKNFIALSRLDHNRAVGQIAMKAGVSARDVRNMIVWSGGAENLYPDTQKCTVQGKSAEDALKAKGEPRFIKDDLKNVLMQRGDAVVKARKAPSSFSTARAITQQIHDLHCGTPPGEFVSMGVITDGSAYGLPAGLVFSLPVMCKGKGEYEVVKSLKLDVTLEQWLRKTEKLISQEKALIDVIVKT